MDQPKFSIIVCCWNSSDYISDCITSITSQFYEGFEIVFVDGGSEDGTLEKIDAVTCKKVVLNNIRGGISKAMNAGVSVASGEIIAHLHADDYFANSSVLSRVARAFEDNAGTKWLYGRFYNLRDGVLAPPSYPVRKYSVPTLMRRNIIPHCATFIMRDVFIQMGGFSDKYRLAMDYDLWLRLSRCYVPVQMDEYLGVFRRHGESSTTKFALQSFNEDFLTRFKNSPPYLALRYVYRRFREVR